MLLKEPDMKSTAVFFAALAASAPLPACAADSAMSGELAPAVLIEVGKMLYTVSGAPVAPVYKITRAGEPRVIVDGRLVTIPATSLAMSDRKLTTTLSNPEIARLARR
jgi:hypothetical protein